jgi:hypothetical protein
MANPGDEQDLEGLIAEAFPEQMITNWIIIAEVVDEDSRDLHLGSSPGMTTWLGAGMLECAKEILMSRELEALVANDDWDEGEEEK